MKPILADLVALAVFVGLFLAIVLVCLLGARRASMARRAADAVPDAFAAPRQEGCPGVLVGFGGVLVLGVVVAAMLSPYRELRIGGVLLWFAGGGAVLALGLRARATCRRAAARAVNAIVLLSRGTRMGEWEVEFTCDGRLATLSVTPTEHIRFARLCRPKVPSPGGITVRFQVQAASRSRVEVWSAGGIGVLVGRRALAGDPRIDNRLLVYARDPEHAARILTVDVQRELLALVTAFAMRVEGREVVFTRQVLQGPVWRPYFPSAREILDSCQQCARVAESVERALLGCGIER